MGWWTQASSVRVPRLAGEHYVSPVSAQNIDTPILTWQLCVAQCRRGRSSLSSALLCRLIKSAAGGGKEDHGPTA